MRTALCISGQPRRVKECYLYILENIILPNTPCDVFLHVWLNSQWEDEWTPFWNTPVDQNAIAQLTELYNPASMLVEKQKEFETDHFDPRNTLFNEGQYRIDASVSMFYSMQRCNMLKKFYEIENGFTYDVVARTRPDFKIETKIKYDDYDLDAMNIRRDCTHEEGCTNDHFAFSTSANIDFYSDCFNHLDEIVNQDGSVFCPEIVLGRYLKKYNMPINFVELKSEIYR